MKPLGLASVDVAIGVLVVLTLAVFALLVWGGIIAYRGFQGRAIAAQKMAFEGLTVANGPAKDCVEVTFHTYYGFIAFVTQTEYRFWAEPDQARLALWRLHRFNCRWGLFAYGAFFIPFVSYANYLIQKRSIVKQSGRRQSTTADILE
jgi:hypothetical protein